MKVDNYNVGGYFEIIGKPCNLGKYLNNKTIWFEVVSKDIHCVKIETALLKKCEIIDVNIEQGRRFSVCVEVEGKIRFVEDATLSKYLVLKSHGKIYQIRPF